MRNIIGKVLLVSMLFCISDNISAQEEITYTKKEPRNTWGLGFVYSENGFGVSLTKYFQLSRSIDFSANLLGSGVTDSREVERSDIYGNTYIPDKINRVYMIPLSLGLNMELFKGDLDGSFKPMFSIGVAPTLVLLNPYNKSFFSALGYTTTEFAAGPYVGIGLNYVQSRSMSINMNLSYYYLPLLNGGIESIQYNKIQNVGGVQLLFGMNFMK